MKIIGVLSGKGGVGKTTFAVNLAYKLFLKGNSVGILDIDIHGPNVPVLIGKENEVLIANNNKIQPLIVETKGNKKLEVVSAYYLSEDHNSAIIWRGPIKHQVLQNFIEKTDWDVDYLVVDFPPGTGDEVISFAQLIKPMGDFYAVIVSMPSKVSLTDAQRSFDFCNKMNLKVLGFVENMSSDVFGKGNVKDFAEEKAVPYLGSIELNKAIAESANAGKPFVLNSENNEFDEIVEKIFKIIKSNDNDKNNGSKEESKSKDNSEEDSENSSVNENIQNK